MSYFAKRDTRPKKTNQPSKNSVVTSSHKMLSSADRVLQLQRTIGNQATQALLNKSVIQREDSDQEEETDPLDTFTRQLDNIENELLPDLKTAFKEQDGETALGIMRRLVHYPLLIYAGSTMDVISFNLRGMSTGKFEFMAIYNRFRSLGDDLKKLVDQYSANPAAYPATSLYYDKRRQKQEDRKERKREDKRARKYKKEQKRRVERYQPTERPRRNENG